MSNGHIADNDDRLAAVTTILITEDDKIFLQERDNNPNIAFPGYWALLSGYPQSGEEPFESIDREIHEELALQDGSPIVIASLRLINSIKRTDIERTDYIFFCRLLSSASAVQIREGQGFGLFSIDECLQLERLAPHHKHYLVQYQQHLVSYIEETNSKKREGRVMSDERKITDYVEILKLGDVKDREALEKGGRGYLIKNGEDVSVAMHTDTEAAFLAYLVFQPGVPRGYHYHLRKIEYMLILKGNLHARFEKYDDSNEVFEATLSPGDLMRISPGCIHTFTAMDEKVLAIEYSPQKYVGADVIEV